VLGDFFDDCDNEIYLPFSGVERNLKNASKKNTKDYLMKDLQLKLINLLIFWNNFHCLL